MGMFMVTIFNKVGRKIITNISMWYHTIFIGMKEGYRLSVTERTEALETGDTDFKSGFASYPAQGYMAVLNLSKHPFSLL